MLLNSPVTVAVVLEYRIIYCCQLSTPTHAGHSGKGNSFALSCLCPHFGVFLDPPSLVFGEIMNY